MSDQFDVMRIELRAKAKAKALEAAGKTDKSPNYLTNLLWETISIIDIEQLVKLQFDPKNERGEIKRIVVRRPIKITVKL